jgi:hypothetical protein
VVFFLFPETRYYRNTPVSPTSDDTSDNEAKSNKEIAATEIPENGDSAIPRKPKSYIQGLKLWSGTDPNSSYLSLFFRPIPLVVYPAQIYTFLIYAMLLGFGTCILNTYAPIYQKPPYNMSTGETSLLKIPTLIGNTLGALWGALTDRYCKWLARRNNGVFEPETRLPFLIPAYLLVPAGLLMYFLNP